MIIERLKHLRSAKDLNQTGVAKALGLSQQRYNFYESGRNEPDNTTLIKIADYFAVSTDYLLGKTDDPTPPDDRKATLEEIESGILGVYKSVGLLDPGVEMSDKKRDLIAKLTKTIMESDI